MLVLGIDVGTSGVRTAVLNSTRELVASMGRASHDADSATNAVAWSNAVNAAIQDQVETLRSEGLDPLLIDRLAVDGTSGSMVLTDAALNPVTPAMLYDTSGFDEEAERIGQFAPDSSITRGSSSALARLLHLQSIDQNGQAAHLLHQADYVASVLAGHGLGSDDTNALKTGWDPQTQSWPSWFGDAGVRASLLPTVHRVGVPIGQISADVAASLGLASTVTIHAGTTDSIAAFLASGADTIGDAVTSLGTTLAIKLLSGTRIDDPASGIYSHRVGDAWLAGGASNTGGGVLAHFFSTDDLQALSTQIDPDIASDLDYYPLLKPGERFPTNDPMLPPRISPRPDKDADFLHGLLESIARIEADGFKRLGALGAPKPTRLFTAGGGAKNAVWTAIRQRHIEADFVHPRHAEAAVGVARLCLDG